MPKTEKLEFRLLHKTKGKLARNMFISLKKIPSQNSFPRVLCVSLLSVFVSGCGGPEYPSPNAASAQSPAAKPNLVNGSFDFKGIYNPPGYTNPPTGWSVSGIPVDSGGEDVGAAPFDAGGFWDNGTIPGQGTSGSVAFIQRSGSISQMLSGLVPGHTYQIKYYENARDYLSSEDQEPLVTVLGNHPAWAAGL